jgi:hypothetical protein
MWTILVAAILCTIIGTCSVLLAVKMTTSLLSEMVTATTSALSTSFQTVLSPGVNEQGEIRQPEETAQERMMQPPWEMWDSAEETRPETVISFPTSTSTEPNS